MIRSFGVNDFYFILVGFEWTIILSIVALIGGTVGGSIIALFRFSSLLPLRAGAILFVRFIQGTPLLMQLFLIFFGFTALGYNMSPWMAAVLSLSINASAFLGEIWRGCLQAVPRGQIEAGTALGMSPPSRLCFIIIPQALRIACAPTVGYIVQLIKATSTTSIIGLTELTRAGHVINNATFRPFLIFGLVATLYFLLCWPLSLLSAYFEHRNRYQK